MKLFKIILIALVIFLIGALSMSCASKPDSGEAPENQIVAVQRGNLTVDIPASGNLALSHKEDLAFEIAGTVEEVLVEEGDIVEEGQLLAKLDTSEWEDYLGTLEDQLTAAERNLTAKERTVTTAERTLTTKERVVTTAERQLPVKERALTSAERQITTRELALSQAQVNLQTAEFNLGEIADVKKAQDAVDDAEYDLKFAQAMWESAVGQESPGAELTYWRDQIVSAKARLVEAQQELAAVLAGSSAKVTTDVALEVATKKLQVELAQRQVEDAQIAIEDAQVAVEDAQTAVEDAQTAVEDAKIAIEDAKTAIEDAKTAVEDARKDVGDAQEALDEAKSESTEIVAPFDGFITRVNVEGGDEVLKGTVAVQLADPEKFETDILVSEMDILQVKLEGEAWVEVDAMQGLSLLAEVTHISPTAIIQSGVVNYKVTVEVQSLEAVAQEQQQARQEAMQSMEQGELPEQVKKAIEQGLITEEQAREKMEQFQKGQGTEQRQVPTMLPENFQLREGLTVTVSIIIEERSDVLLVPNSAITRKGAETIVQVLKDGVIEERSIQTGISNWQYTEVTEGLTEGEEIVVPQGTVSTSTTQQQQKGGMFIPGRGGPH